MKINIGQLVCSGKSSQIITVDLEPIEDLMVYSPFAQFLKDTVLLGINTMKSLFVVL